VEEEVVPDAPQGTNIEALPEDDLLHFTKIEYVNDEWTPEKRKSDTVYITPDRREYIPGHSAPVRRYVMKSTGAETSRPPGIHPEFRNNQFFFPEAHRSKVIEAWDKLRAKKQEGPGKATAAAVTRTTVGSNRPDRTTILEFAAYPHSTSLIESQLEAGCKHVSIGMEEAQHSRAMKSITRSVLDTSRNVLLYAHLPENVADTLVMANLWKNFVTCSRMVKKAGGDILWHLPRHSKWWDSSAMIALRHELGVEVANVVWCAYGVEQKKANSSTPRPAWHAATGNC
jgi:hypothetical protein